VKQTILLAGSRRECVVSGRSIRWLCLLFCLGARMLVADAPFLDPVIAPVTRTLIDAAIKEARTSGDVDVSPPRALLYKGLMLFQNEDYLATIPYLEEALRQDPTLMGAWEALGWAYWRTDQKEKAVRHFEAFRRLMPNQALPYSVLAQYAILIQDWKMADANFRKALEINPDQYDLRNWYAQNMMRLGRDLEAEQLLKQLIQEDPDRVDIMITLAQLLYFQQRYEDSAELWTRVLKQLPDNAKFMVELARIQMVLGNLEEADQLCVTALEREPDLYSALMLRADLADIGDMAGASVERLEAVIRATRDAPMRATLRERLAIRCHAFNDRQPGTFPPSYILDQLAQAVQEDPKNVYLALTYSEYCLVFKQYHEARKWARLVLEAFNRHSLRAKEVYFECALGEGLYDEADQILDDLYSAYDPSDPMRKYHQARVDLFRGRYVEAMARLDEMEAQAEKGAVLTLLYHGLTESDWLPRTSVRRLYEHLFALKQAGFTFVSPTDIPALIGAKNGVSPAEDAARDDADDADDAREAVPLPARLIDSLRYSFTGERKFKRVSPQKQMREKYRPPVKNVAVTFDDGLRSSFDLGTPVAEDLGVPFGMFVIAWRADYEPSVVSWEAMRKYAASGSWVIGSHLHDAHADVAVSSDTNYLARALPNRIWIPAKNRLESMNEWDRRMRQNFRLSRKIIDEKLGDAASALAMVAYPYGDIGQEGTCNLSTLRNPVQTLLAEAARNYQLGFALNRNGYTTAGDNSLLVRRYEPAWYDEGADVVRHAYQNHPLFMARALRIELAQVMGKPHVAEAMLKLLRRDGYPEDLIRKMDFANTAHFQNRSQRAEKALYGSAAFPSPVSAGSVQSSVQSSSEGVYTVAADGTRSTPADDGSWYKPSDVSVGAHVYNSQANNEYEVTREGVRGGFNLNPRTWLGAEYTHSTITQQPRPIRTLTDPHDLTLDYTWTNSKINPNVLTGAKASREDIRLRSSYRFDSGSTLAASIGLANYGLGQRGTRETDSSTLIGDLTYSWFPSEKVGMSAFYSHDILAVAYRLVTSDTLGLNAGWKVSDTWASHVRSQYSLYGDDNAMYQFAVDSFWDVAPELNLSFGLEYAMASTSDYNPYYWTPYWDERVSAIFRYAQAWPGYAFNIDMIFGHQREGARPQEYNEWGVFYGDATEWENAWGMASTYRQQLKKHWDLMLDVRTMFLRSYADHSFYLSLDYTF
jgi:tetratricopeptide (TPR) repeat protein